MSGSVPIADIRIGKRRRKDMGDLTALANSIAADELLQPIVVTPDFELMAGQCRLEAFKLLGRDAIPAHIVNIDSIVRGEFVENALRKELTISEKVAIGAILEAALGEHQGERTDLQHRDAHLFEPERIIEAWGFTYKTALTWFKDKMGTGDWLRGHRTLPLGNPRQAHYHAHQPNHGTASACEGAFAEARPVQNHLALSVPLYNIVAGEWHENE